MRKIPKNLENPIDNAIIDICDPLSKFFHSLHFNPNDITTLSLIFGILSILLLYRGQTIAAVACYFISYVFDCCDGYYARKYRMCTKFGDLYDHFKDWIVYIMYTYVLYTRNKEKLSKKQWISVLLVFLFLLGLQLVHFAAQERYHNKLDNIPSLGWLASFVKTKEQARNVLSVTRFFGCGTFILTIMAFTVYVEYKK